MLLTGSATNFQIHLIYDLRFTITIPLFAGKSRVYHLKS